MTSEPKTSAALDGDIHDYLRDAASGESTMEVLPAPREVLHSGLDVSSYPVAALALDRLTHRRVKRSEVPTKKRVAKKGATKKSAARRGMKKRGKIRRAGGKSRGPKRSRSSIAKSRPKKAARGTGKKRASKKRGTPRRSVEDSGAKRRPRKKRVGGTALKDRAAVSRARRAVPVDVLSVVRRAIAEVPEGPVRRGIHGASGRIGRLVFISALHRRIGKKIGMDLPSFKRWLVEQNRLGNLVLQRADVVDMMPQKMVDDSEVHHLGAQFHFVLDREYVDPHGW